jgi:hypothetical protein
MSKTERRHEMQRKIRAMLYSMATLATLLLSAGARWKPK